ncbi:MAG TPA: SigE family RNA polymerase sigma factor [Jatrophihabitans sp.]
MTFEEYVSAQVPVMLRTATFFTGELAAAEDLVQDVLIKVHGRWEQIAALESPEGYVRRMLVNEFLTQRRRWGRVLPVSDVPGEKTQDDHAPAHADRQVLRSELARLPRRQRVALVLRYYGGYSDTEIAEALSCRPGTVRSLLSRGLAALRITPALRSEYAAEPLVLPKGAL